MANIPPATTTATPEQELAALVAKVTVLSKLALEMTKHCIDLHDALPGVIASQVAAALAAVTGPSADFIQGSALTPNELDALFPPGVGENQTWHVVCIGRNPGLYPSAEDADEQVKGVPNQFRQKKAGRVEALSFYRYKYNRGEVLKFVDIVATAAAAGASASH
ncbi:hypothetical protein FB451DRAFT_1360221 [Mycena latifolia]|nr:hypothetical protein FB451DRAFT_1569152 [Mycena latifolia]KAJ7495436.1 hypothetical protein FB451DRAFT_1360221 [Mycena latifolia]